MPNQTIFRHVEPGSIVPKNEVTKQNVLEKIQKNYNVEVQPDEVCPFLGKLRVVLRSVTSIRAAGNGRADYRARRRLTFSDIRTRI